VLKLAVTLAGHGQLVKSLTATKTLSIRLSAVSRAGNSKQEGKRAGEKLLLCAVMALLCAEREGNVSVNL